MIAGWFDWRGPHPGAPAARLRRDASGRGRIAGPGVSVSVDAQADVAIRDGWVAIAMGDLTAARWIDLLAADGERAAASAHGRYAVAAFDVNRRQAVLATDRFAVWPLCYGAQGSRLAFADRADTVPLLEDPDLDPQALFDYLYFHVIPAPRTIYRNVSRLDAACTLAFDARAPGSRGTGSRSFDESGRGELADLEADFLALHRGRGGAGRPTTAYGVLPERRHRQLHRRRHARRDRTGRPVPHLLHRLRRRGLRRDGVRAHRRRATSAPSTTSTT